MVSLSLETLMHSLQLLNVVPHVLHTRPQALADDLLHLLIHIQEPFNEFAIDEAERAVSLAFSVPESSISFEIELASRLNHSGNS